MTTETGYLKRFDYEIITPNGTVVRPPNGHYWRYSDLEAKDTSKIDKESYMTFLESPVNLVKNPSFETDDVWHGGANDKACRIADGGLFGKRMGVVELAEGQKGWHGLYQEGTSTLAKKEVP